MFILALFIKNMRSLGVFVVLCCVVLCCVVLCCVVLCRVVLCSCVVLCCVVCFLFTQAGFYGSYSADVGLQPSSWFPRTLSEYSFTDLREDGQLSWLLASAEWFRPVRDSNP